MLTSPRLSSLSPPSGTDILLDKEILITLSNLFGRVPMGGGRDLVMSPTISSIQGPFLSLKLFLACLS